VSRRLGTREGINFRRFIKPVVGDWGESSLDDALNVNGSIHGYRVLTVVSTVRILDN
jgi:hypothetical protein